MSSILDQCFDKKIAPVVAAMCGADADFARHVITVGAAGRHYVSAVVAFAAAAPGGAGNSPAGLKSLAHAVQYERRKDVFARFLDEPAPGLSGVLNKLSGRRLKAETYHSLAALLKRSSSGKVLRHLNTIRPVHIRALETLPEALHRVNIIAPLEDKYDPPMLAVAFQAAQKIRPDMDAVQLAVSLHESVGGKIEKPQFKRTVSGRKVKLTAPYDEAVCGWLERLMLNNKLPEPPWSGGGDIKPITTPAAMHAAGMRGRNCLGGQIADVLSGRVFYFEHTGVPKAYICLEKGAVFGWRVGDILGPDNQELTKQHAHRIEKAFVNAGFGPRMDAIRGGLVYHLLSENGL